MPYSPGALDPNAGTEEVRVYLERELNAIAKALNEPGVVIAVIQAREPAKPREAMLVYADGTGWDPGSGAGFYEYRSGAWHKL